MSPAQPHGSPSWSKGVARSPQLGCGGGCGWQEEAGTSRGQPAAPQQMEAPDVTPAGVGVGCEGHGQRTKARFYSFHQQPLAAASLPWIVRAFSLLQLFTGSPRCGRTHKERAIR